MTGNQDDRPADSSAGGDESYEQLLDDYSHLAAPSEGGVIRGHVLDVAQFGVIVDIGEKQEGIVPLHQVTAPDGSIVVEKGMEIDVIRDRRHPPVEGYISLSHELASKRRAWTELERAYREGLAVYGRVLGRVKGGLSVDVGVTAFMPSTQLDVRPVHNLESWVGQDVEVKILKLNRRRDNVVVSRKMVLESDIVTRKSALLDHIKEGDVVQGVVKNLTDYGAFVDLGGIDGLLHVSDMSHGRVTHPASILHVGQELPVKVLKFDREKERISLGLKQVAPDPWDTVVERYQPGMRVVGVVVSITDYGAFVELEGGVEGLIHISEMTWSRRMKHPSKVVKVNDHVEAVVLEVKPSDRRISLGMKQLEPDPWTTVDQRYFIGSVVEGRVRKLTDFGAFIEIEEGIDGLVHISDLSWTKRVQHPSEVLKKGQVVQAVILSIDAPNRRLSLGIKQLQPDAWETLFRERAIGDTITGKPTRVVSFGVFVELAPGVEGLCHNTELPPEFRGPDSQMPLHQEMTFKIIKMNEAERRVGLSFESASGSEEKQRLEDYHRQAQRATHSIEEALQAGEIIPPPAERHESSGEPSPQDGPADRHESGH